jgi:hypothetical protein
MAGKAGLLFQQGLPSPRIAGLAQIGNIYRKEIS